MSRIFSPTPGRLLVIIFCVVFLSWTNVLSCVNKKNYKNHNKNISFEIIITSVVRNNKSYLFIFVYPQYLCGILFIVTLVSGIAKEYRLKVLDIYIYIIFLFANIFIWYRFMFIQCKYNYFSLTRRTLTYTCNGRGVEGIKTGPSSKNGTKCVPFAGKFAGTKRF